MEVIKLKTPKGKEVEIPLSEKETDIEKPRLTIIKNGKKLYAPLVKEKPKNKEEFIIVRTTDGINYYVGESKKEDTSKITKYIGRFKGSETAQGTLMKGGVFKVPAGVHVLRLSLGKHFKMYLNVDPEQILSFSLYGRKEDAPEKYRLYRLEIFTFKFPLRSVDAKYTFFSWDMLQIECNGEIENFNKKLAINMSRVRGVPEDEYKKIVDDYGFDKVDDSGGSGGIAISSDDGSDIGD